MNYYPIIIGLVALGGLIISAWGWRVLQQSQTKKQWPTVEGKIVKSESTSELNELLPHIVFSYQVEGETYTQLFKFPEGTHPLPEFTQSYLRKYPVGQAVTIFYNPNDVTDATLEPATQGDWMILALGILMTAGAISIFLFS